MKRRGQLFSLDAMIALVVVILMLGTVTATSENLRNELTYMVGWYERANIADNMLDVLTKSPGEPANWIDDPSNVRLVGLADNRSGGIAYQKVLKLVEEVENNNLAVKASLAKMCNDKDFELLFFQGKWSFEVNYSWDPTLSGTGAWNFKPWPGDCRVAGSERYDLDYPAVSYCDPLLVTGSLHVIDSESFCVIGDLDGRGSVTYDIGHYPPATPSSGNIGVDEPYLAIDGDWVIEGAVTTHVEGDIFINGALIVVGGGTRTVNVAHDMYIFGNTAHTPLFDPGQSFSITIGIWGYSLGNLYVKYEGIWYAATGNPWSVDSWYKFTGTDWVPVTTSEFDTVIKGNIIPARKPNNVDVTINGYVPPNDWQEPMPECWAGGMPLDVTNATANYTFPTNVTGNASSGIITNISPAFYKILVKIGGEITVNPDMDEIIESRNNSPWVEVAERRTTLAIMNYSPRVVIAGDELQRVLAGRLIAPLSYYTFMQVTVPNNTGYAMFIVRDGTTLKVLGVWRNANGNVGGALWIKTPSGMELSKTYRGNGNSIWVPWVDLFSYFNVESGRKIVELWAYRNTLGDVIITDLGGIGGFLVPKEEPFVIKLWVWDEP